MRVLERWLLVIVGISLIAFETAYFFTQTFQTVQVNLSNLLPPAPGEQFYQGPALPVKQVSYTLHPWGNPSLALTLFTEAIAVPSSYSPIFIPTNCVTSQFTTQLVVGSCYQNTTVISNDYVTIDLVFYNTTFSQPRLYTAYYSISLAQPVLQASYCSSSTARQLLQINSSILTIADVQPQRCLNIYYESATFTAS